MAEIRNYRQFRNSSARAVWHDYNGGMYFITICTKGRKHYFGEISDGKMNLTEIGKYTDAIIKDITKHNRHAEIPLYVIMPDHIHLIVVIDGVDRDAPWHVSI